LHDLRSGLAGPQNEEGADVSTGAPNFDRIQKF